MDPLVQSLLAGFGVVRKPAAGESRLDSAVDQLDDAGSYIRYGMDRGKKRQLVTEGKIPGVEPRMPHESEEQYLDRSDRQASGYLYGHRWPNFGPMTTDALSVLRGFLGDENDMIEQGNTMIDRGAADSKRRGLFGGMTADIGRR